VKLVIILKTAKVIPAVAVKAPHNTIVMRLPAAALFKFM